MRSFWRKIFPLLFGLLIYTTVRLVNDSAERSKFWERPLLLNLLEIVVVIITSYLLQLMLDYFIDKFQKNQPMVISSRTVLKEFLIVFLCCELIVNLTVTPMAAFTDDGLGINDIVIINIIPELYVLLYFAIVRGNHYLNAYVENRLMLEKITNDHLTTELKFLKAQYHPHFLFNALNTVYFQMDEDVAAAKKSIEKFSGLLRYQLYDQQQMINISQELEYLKNYIQLQEVRVSEQLRMTIYFDPALQHQQVYTLLFLPFVENAFKYIGGEYILEISAKCIMGRVEFYVFNSKPDQFASSSSHKGIGLENLRRRLELLYPGDHELKFGHVEKGYQAKLAIPLENPNRAIEHETEMRSNG